MRAALAAIALLAVAVGCGGGDESGAADCDVQLQDGARRGEFAPLERGRTYRIEFETTHGSFTVELDAAQSRCNGGSMLALARDGFFDGTRFHRIVPGFVIQGGDPTGTGTGGPGYTTRDAPQDDWTYTKGTVAMAKSQAEPSGTGGSQFFVVTGADASLPPEYAVIGRVAEGMAVVERIGELGDPATEVPRERVVIERATAVGE